MRRILSFFAVWLTLSFPIYAVNDATAVWGGFGRRDNVYSCADTEEKIIALTFDDGPHPKYTDEILAILNKYDVKATFFVIGRNAEGYPAILKRIADGGHEIGNHTFTHVTAEKVSSKEFKAELEKTHSAIRRITGKAPELFRPPTGHCNAETVQSAAEMDYKLIVWTVDTKDWTHESTENIIKTVKTRTKSGSIILFHDYIASPSPTPNALRVIIPHLLSQGYRFVTVSELLSYDGV